MATISKNQVQFVVSEVGEITKEKWYGTFTVKLRLSHRDRLRIDQLRRDLLGPSPEGTKPSERADNTAEIFSQLAVRIVDAPSWWTNNNGGLELEDDNIISSVYTATMKEVLKDQGVVAKAGEDAQAELKKEGPVVE